MSALNEKAPCDDQDYMLVTTRLCGKGYGGERSEWNNGAEDDCFVQEISSEILSSDQREELRRSSEACQGD
ncbi:hypothetical protein RRG08_048294 [Elysia crispata]|uniref:Uncharacterized protein n=1 Tax=Elysia crispata TaxID=231223 RepID=A0AAE0ZT64_9GAST|nr:hypothetical protein RRG08_048294 [Elysia crispata]